MKQRGVFLGLLVCIIGASGCGDFWRDLSGTKSRVDNPPPSGTCTSDPEVVKQVILTPPNCSQATPCPCGSYCSDEVGGICLVDCRSNAECASGKTCSPWGQCLGSGSVDAGVPPNPSCPRNLMLLMSPATTGRQCEFDDACPFGAHCDPATGLCSFECTSDSDCPTDAGTSLVCSCLGTCVPLGSPPGTHADGIPTLKVTPSHFSLPSIIGDPPTTPDWGAGTDRHFSVTLTLDRAPSGPPPEISITPGKDLLAFCPSQFPSAAPCHFTPGDFVLQSDGTYATPAADIGVMPIPTLDVVGDSSWLVRVGAEGAAGTPKVVTLSYADPPPAGGPLSGGAFEQVNSLSGAFKGAGTLEFTSPTGQPIQVPVLGVGSSDWGMLLYDASKTITPSGKLALYNDNLLGFETQSSATGNDYLDFYPGGPANSATGVYGSNITNQFLSQRVVGGEIQEVAASFNLYFVQPFNVYSPSGRGPDENYHTDLIHMKVHLTKASASSPAFCDQQAPSPCGGGMVCDLGFCSPDRQVMWDMPVGRDALSARAPAGGVFAVTPWRIDAIGFPFTSATNVICNNDSMSGRILPFSGDVACGFGNNLTIPPPNMTVPLVNHRDLEATGFREGKTAAELLSACLSDLGRRDPLDPNASHEFARVFGSQGGPGMPTDYVGYFGDCVSLGSWRTAAFLARRDSAGLLAGDPNANDVYTALLHRLLQQWVEVHTFVAREALQEHELDDVIGNPANPGPSLDTVLLQTETGWAWLLNELGAVKNFKAQNIDYRHMAEPGTNCSNDGNCTDGRICDLTRQTCVAPPLSKALEHEAAAGLPTTMLHGATAHLQLVDKLTGDRLRQLFAGGSVDSPVSALAMGGRGLRFALLIESMAATIKTYYDGLSTCSDCRDPAFGARWNAALQELQAARSSLVNTMASVRTGTNPLGIFDTDAPLYFGDPQGTNSRYFAGSDYLLDGWTAPAVASAQTSLNAAREAWIAQQNSVVQDLDAQANRAHYVDQLQSTYADKILNNCGPLMSGGQPLGETNLLQAVANGQIDLDTCFIAPECIGTDDVTAGAIRHKVIKDTFTPGVAGFNLCIFDQLKDAVPTTFTDTINLRNLTFQQRIDQNNNNPIATAFLYPQTPEPGFTDIACFLGGSAPNLPPRCSCDDTSDGTKVYSDGTQACNGQTGCWTICGKRNCGGPTVILCDPSAPCNPDNKSGCTYPNNCLFRRDYQQLTNFHRALQESEMIPDEGFEEHPWTKVKTEPTVNGFNIVTMQPRRMTGAVCRIPADYLYGYVPSSWHYTDLSLAMPQQWMSAYVTCSSGAKIAVTPTPFQPDVRYPSGDSPLPMPEMQDSCFSGAMGSAVRNIKGAALTLRRSEETIAANVGRIDDIFNSCLVKVDQAQKDADQRAHNGLLGALEIIGAIAAIIAAAALAYVTLGAGSPALLAVIAAVGASGGAIALKRADVERDLANLEARFANVNSVQACWSEYRQTVRAMASLNTEIEIASNTVSTEEGTLTKFRDENHQAFQDGNAKLIIEQGRKYGSYAHNYWFDDKVTRFRTELEWSRKLTYLSLLAVEYEFQQSLPYRADVLTATNPDKLEQVVLALKQEQISRTVNGRRPESASTVISLRDDVLAIPDLSQLTTAGERNWTPAQRFEGRLRNRAYSYYAKDGTYLGQAVNFDLAPQGILENRCGERMWRVTATIQGDGLSDTTPNAPIMLLKSNTFSSQWCDAGGIDKDGMQSSSVHPSSKLFRPGDNPVTQDSFGFTPALMYPWFNVRRTDFYKQSYQDGSSEELAGRGLYGQYRLLFPKQLLDDGFPLEKVEDVLLRIDYLSVDNLSQ